MNKQTISRIVNRLVTLQSERKATAAEEKSLKAKLSAQGVRSFEGSLGTATVFEVSGRPSLNRALLIETLSGLLGEETAQQVIDECTKPGKPTLQCKVTPAADIRNAA